MKRNKVLKSTLKKIYRIKKLQDGRDIGRKKNDLVQSLHLQRRLPQESRDAELIKQIGETLALIAKEHRFRDDFPSFAKFYAYMTNAKNGFTVEDLKDL